MRRYETIVIIDPDLSDEERKPVLERINDLIPQQGGIAVMIDDCENRKLAYDIKKKSRGYYVRIDFCGTGSLVDEMERFFRIDDRVLKYMTVLVEKDVDIERVKKEKAEAEAEAEAEAQRAALLSETETEPESSDIAEIETETVETTSPPAEKSEEK
jgi:small subunit ribosomal protein S6